MDQNEIQWLKATVNDLNNLLQVIAESSTALKPLCDSNPEGRRYYSFLSSGLVRANNVAAEMSERLGKLGIEQAAPSPSPNPPPPAPEPAPPQKPSPRPAAPRRVASVAEVRNPDGERELIMIIDDESIVLDIASAVLTDAGYRVIALKDVFKALDTYRALCSEIALVVLDFTMPIMDGPEVFEELRKISPNASVMLSSGFAEQEKVRAMLARGLRGFLPKPYSRERLLAQIRSTLDALRSEVTGERRVL